MLADRLVGVAGYHRPQVAAIRVPGVCGGVLAAGGFARVKSAPHGPLISSERVAEVRLTRLSFTTGRKEPRAACRVVVVDETDSLR